MADSDVAHHEQEARENDFVVHVLRILEGEQGNQLGIFVEAWDYCNRAILRPVYTSDFKQAISRWKKP